MKKQHNIVTGAAPPNTAPPIPVHEVEASGTTVSESADAATEATVANGGGQRPALSEDLTELASQGTTEAAPTETVQTAEEAEVPSESASEEQAAPENASEMAVADEEAVPVADVPAETDVATESTSAEVVSASGTAEVANESGIDPVTGQTHGPIEFEANTDPIEPEEFDEADEQLTSAGDSGSSDEVELQKILAVPIVMERTPRILEALQRENKSQLQVGIDLYEVGDKIGEKSFRTWVAKILEIEDKKAYYLRSAGKMFVVLVRTHKVRPDLAADWGVQRLVTLSRFPEKSWRVDGHQVFVSGSNGEELLADLSNDELRTRLQEAKEEEAGGKPIARLKKRLAAIGENRMRPEIEQQVAPIRDVLQPLVDTWLEDLDKQIERKQKALDTAKESLKDREQELLTLQVEKRDAAWWHELLHENEDQAASGDVERRAGVERKAAAAAAANAAKARRQTMRQSSQTATA